MSQRTSSRRPSAAQTPSVSGREYRGLLRTIHENVIIEDEEPSTPTSSHLAISLNQLTLAASSAAGKRKTDAQKPAEQLTDISKKCKQSHSDSAGDVVGVDENKYPNLAPTFVANFQRGAEEDKEYLAKFLQDKKYTCQDAVIIDISVRNPERMKGWLVSMGFNQKLIAGVIWGYSIAKIEEVLEFLKTEYWLKRQQSSSASAAASFRSRMMGSSDSGNGQRSRSASMSLLKEGSSLSRALQTPSTSKPSSIKQTPLVTLATSSRSSMRLGQEEAVDATATKLASGKSTVGAFGSISAKCSSSVSISSSSSSFASSSLPLRDCSKPSFVRELKLDIPVLSESACNSARSAASSTKSNSSCGPTTPGSKDSTKSLTDLAQQLSLHAPDESAAHASTTGKRGRAKKESKVLIRRPQSSSADANKEPVYETLNDTREIGLVDSHIIENDRMTQSVQSFVAIGIDRSYSSNSQSSAASDGSLFLSGSFGGEGDREDVPSVNSVASTPLSANMRASSASPRSERARSGSSTCSLLFGNLTIGEDSTNASIAEVNAQLGESGAVLTAAPQQQHPWAVSTKAFPMPMVSVESLNQQPRGESAKVLSYRSLSCSSDSDIPETPNKLCRSNSGNTVPSAFSGSASINPSAEIASPDTDSDCSQRHDENDVYARPFPTSTDVEQAQHRAKYVVVQKTRLQRSMSEPAQPRLIPCLLATSQPLSARPNDISCQHECDIGIYLSQPNPVESSPAPKPRDIQFCTPTTAERKFHFNFLESQTAPRDSIRTLARRFTAIMLRATEAPQASSSAPAPAPAPAPVVSTGDVAVPSRPARPLKKATTTCHLNLGVGRVGIRFSMSPGDVPQHDRRAGDLASSASSAVRERPASGSVSFAVAWQHPDHSSSEKVKAAQVDAQAMLAEDDYCLSNGIDIEEARSPGEATADDIEMHAHCPLEHLMVRGRHSDANSDSNEEECAAYNRKLAKRRQEDKKKSRALPSLLHAVGVGDAAAAAEADAPQSVMGVSKRCPFDADINDCTNPFSNSFNHGLSLEGEEGDRELNNSFSDMTAVERKVLNSRSKYRRLSVGRSRLMQAAVASASAVQPSCTVTNQRYTISSPVRSIVMPQSLRSTAVVNNGDSIATMFVEADGAAVLSCSAIDAPGYVGEDDDDGMLCLTQLDDDAGLCDERNGNVAMEVVAPIPSQQREFQSTYQSRNLLRDLCLANVNLIRSVLSFASPELDQASLCQQLGKVCKSWAIGIRIVVASSSIHLLNPSIASVAVSVPDVFSGCGRHVAAEDRVSALRDRWESYLSQHSSGRFLSRGACKDVYAVRLSRSAQKVAVSVMDLEELASRSGNDEESVVQVLYNELAISLMCDQLSRLNICPNLTRIHHMFLSPFSTPSKLWNSSNSSGTSSCIKLKDVYTKQELKEALSNSARQSHRYQYVCMEFCTMGDAETHLKSLYQSSSSPSSSLMSRQSPFNVFNIQCALFQMCYSLYCVRDQFQLRHFDVKLLNFFATSGESLLTVAELDMYRSGCRAPLAGPVEPGKRAVRTSSRSSKSSSSEPNKLILLKIGFGRRTFTVPIQQEQSPIGLGLIKLADFGTSLAGVGISAPAETEGARRSSSSCSSCSSSCGGQQPVYVGPDQFTTLENTPPEFLLFGSTVKQANAFRSADVWCLGLCAMHLLTMTGLPYEELMADCVCPAYLLEQLKQVWEGSPSSRPSQRFEVVKEVIESLVESGDRSDRTSPGHPCRTLYDTLYRYLVLTGYDELQCMLLADANADEDHFIHRQIASALIPSLSESSSATSFTKPIRKANSSSCVSKKLCQQNFRTDSDKWNLRTGCHPAIRQMRSNLQAIGGNAEEVFHRMLSLDINDRCSTYEVLTSDLFGALCSETAEVSSSLSSPSSSIVKQFSYYDGISDTFLKGV